MRPVFMLNNAQKNISRRASKKLIYLSGRHMTWLYCSISFYPLNLYGQYIGQSYAI